MLFSSSNLSLHLKLRRFIQLFSWQATLSGAVPSFSSAHFQSEDHGGL
jgi:hypothetical protein